MPTTCNIEFDNNPTGTYYGGETLNARILLNLDIDTDISGIAIRIHGYAEMEWSENRASYRLYEEHINIKTFLLGTPTSGSKTLKAGEHEFLYNYELPKSCPSSLQSQYGKIRYKVKVMLIRPWKLEKAFTKGFTLIKLVDLNQEPMALIPVTAELEKTFGSSRNPTPPLIMKVDIPQSGYIAGQKIPVSVFIINESGKSIKELRISLDLIVSCFGNRPKPKVYEWVTKASKLNVSLGNEMKHNSVHELIVPPAVPSDNTNCPFIHVSYQVKVEAVMPLLQPNVLVIIPVFIGTVPLASGLDDDIGASTSAMALIQSLPIPDDLPPPTYEKAMEAINKYE